MLNNDIVPIELDEKGKIEKDLFKQGHNFWFSACDRDLNKQIINVASGMEDVKIIDEKYFTICQAGRRSKLLFHDQNRR